jgi:uncharacterized cupin superfamily protein
MVETSIDPVINPKIELHTATAQERAACQHWELWNSGDLSEFFYEYAQDVEFIVQQGKAVINSQFGDSVAIEAGSRVIIRAGIAGHWDIQAPIVNRYTYLD